MKLTQTTKKECCVESSPIPPQQSNVEESSCEDEKLQAEKEYISLISSERSNCDDEKSPFVAGKRIKGDIVDGEKRESNQDIYNFHNMSRKSCDTIDFGLHSERDKKLIASYQRDSIFNREIGQQLRKKRGSYKNTVVEKRIYDFLNDFEEIYPIGSQIDKQELEHWMQRLFLAEDRLTIRQYLKRFLMHGYFTANKGLFIFQSKTPKQLTFKEVRDVKKSMMQIRALTRKPKRRRSF